MNEINTNNRRPKRWMNERVMDWMSFGFQIWGYMYRITSAINLVGVCGFIVMIQEITQQSVWS